MNKLSKWIPFCLPEMIGFSVIYLYSFGKSVSFSFLSDLFSRKFVGLANYRVVAGNGYFRLALRNTLWFSVFGVSMVMILSVFLAHSIFLWPDRLFWVRRCLILPLLLPSSGIISLWGQLFRPVASGIWIQDNFPLLLMFLWKNCGLATLILSTALLSVPAELKSAALLDGASPRALLLQIYLPLIRPNLSFIALLEFVNALGIYRESHLFYRTDYPPEHAYLLQYYMNNHFKRLDYEILATATVILVALMATLISVFYWAQRKAQGDQ